jgi:hypothetical protein
MKTKVNLLPPLGFQPVIFGMPTLSNYQAKNIVVDWTLLFVSNSSLREIDNEDGSTVFLCVFIFAFLLQVPAKNQEETSVLVATRNG